MLKYEYLADLVAKIIAEEPKARDDEGFLLGLVYENYLGENADIYSLRYCEKHFRSLGLPTKMLVRRALKNALNREGKK